MPARRATNSSSRAWWINWWRWAKILVSIPANHNGKGFGLVLLQMTFEILSRNDLNGSCFLRHQSNIHGVFPCVHLFMHYSPSFFKLLLSLPLDSYGLLVSLVSKHVEYVPTHLCVQATHHGILLHWRLKVPLVVCSLPNPPKPVV